MEEQRKTSIGDAVVQETAEEEDESAAPGSPPPGQRSSTASSRAPGPKVNYCTKYPLLMLGIVIATIMVAVWCSVVPYDYFHPEGATDSGGMWCDVAHHEIPCRTCVEPSRVFMIEEKIENPALIIDALYKWKYHYHDHWDFNVDLRGLSSRTRAFFGLLTFDRKYVNVIALKFLLESNASGYAFHSHFEIPAEKPFKTAPDVINYVNLCASEMKGLFSNDWTFLQPIAASFLFRIDRSDKGGFLRHKSCMGQDCGEKAFDGSTRLENTYSPLEKKQVFFMFHDKAVQSNAYDLNFQKRCYITDEHYNQFCPDKSQNGLMRCKLFLRDVMDKITNLTDMNKPDRRQSNRK